MKINAIVFGATGMVGEGVLNVCLNHTDVERVLVVSRRPCEVNHPKLKEVLHKDFYDYSSIEQELKGYNACYFCLGVTSVGKNAEQYTLLTYDLTLQAARTLSRLNPDMTFCYVSGEGTDSSEHGRLMWARVKGKTENDLRKLPFKASFAFRPGFIKPMKGQKHAYGVSKVLGTVYPVLKALFSKHISTLEDVGLAMVNVTLRGYPKPVLENRDIALAARKQAP